MWSLGFDNSNQLSSDHQLYYGVEYVVNNVLSTAYIRDIETGALSSGAARYPNSTWSSLGAYATYDWNVNKMWNLKGGLRYNLFDIQSNFDTTFYDFAFTETSLSNDALTGSIGVSYIKEDWVLGGNFSTGFRAPNVDDIGKLFDSEPGSVVVPNPDLVAEYTFNQDLSVVRTFDKRYRVELTLFYSYLRDAMVRRDDQINGLDSIYYEGVLSNVQSVQNAAYARVYGGNLSVLALLHKNLKAKLDLNVQKGVEELDNGSVAPMRHVAPSFGRLSFEYNEKDVKLILENEFSAGRSFEQLADSEIAKDFIYAKDDEGNPYVPAWMIQNLRFNYALSNNLTFRTSVENVFNVLYRPYSSGISGAGRNFQFSLSVRF